MDKDKQKDEITNGVTLVDNTANTPNTQSENIAGAVVSTSGASVNGEWGINGKPPHRKPAGEKGESGRGGSERRGRGGRQPRDQSDPDHAVLAVRRVARVVAGGRRFSFAAVVVTGDRRGTVGVGTGKAADTAAAVTKAIMRAKKNAVKISLTKEHGIAHEAEAKYCASRVFLSPSTGLIAGGTPRIVLTLAGVRNVNAKILSRSKNHINNARATVKALTSLV